jgi:16S rRNA (uracil1498-N3)-methyltransferase
MNIVVLEVEEVGARLPRSDRRWGHIKKILRKVPGDRILAGVVGGDLGMATILELDDEGLRLGFEAGRPADSLTPMGIILGFPRPIQAARILKDLASLGVAEILLCGTELGEKSYQQSGFFRKQDFRRYLIEGAEQAGNPRLPRVLTHGSLRSCLDSIRNKVPEPGSRIALHPGCDSPPLGSIVGVAAPVLLAVGSERGWSPAEIALLKERGFEERSLGARILRTETATVAAVVLVLSRLGIM